MTATLPLLTAITKVRYADGCPDSIFERAHCEVYSLMPSQTDAYGDPYHVALRHESNQNTGHTFGIAQNVDEPSKYVAFDLPGVTQYTFARASGPVIKKLQDKIGAMTAAWTNEVDGAMLTAIIDIEILAHGDGTGIRGVVAGGDGQAGTPLTLTIPSDISKFFLGMKIQAVSNRTVSPVVTPAADATGSNCPKVMKINRKTSAMELNPFFTPAPTGQFLVRAGDAASGKQRVAPGFSGFVRYDGVNNPGSFYNVDANNDPIRLAGQLFDARNSSIEDLIVDGSAEVRSYGGNQPKIAMFNPRRVAKLRKELNAKSIYDRAELTSQIANVSFKTIVVHGDDGDINVMSNPFLNITEGELWNMSSWVRKSAGPAPEVADLDGNEMLRVYNADVYEMRVTANYTTACDAPVDNVRYANVGL
ncbi:MAG TPA: hypothetical protein VLI21_14740 [Casimicrobiaceae bacterium]|nr:hypothetical protein [Casimicrobiaceae bacterium]